MARRAGSIHLRIILFIAAIALSPVGLMALQPPRSGEVKKYAADGSFAKRLANSAQFGNHRTHPQLIWNLQRKLLKAQGQTDAQIAAAMGNAPPPAWRGGLPSSGTPKVAVLMVDFAEYPHAANQTQADVSNKFFGGGNTSDAPYESLRNYYQRASYSKLTIQGTVFDWYRATYSRAYYEGLGFGPGEEALMMEALNYWVAQGYDFSQFDNDGDGRIDSLFIKWTGPDNGWANFWWAYQWEWHSNPSYRVSGKSLGNYVWSWIANVNYDGRSDYYPRTDIHETGHLLGLPDLYDYDGTQGPKGGVGGLDMMDSNWGDHNCFSKYMLDWLAPTEVLSGSTARTLNPSGTSQDCVLVMPGIPSGTLFGEFFMAQYRKRSVGNDPANYPTDGLVIWHVDSTLDTAGTNFKWDNSYTAHKYLRLMEADGLEQIEQNSSANAGDYYVPGRTFNNTTAPNSRAYSGNATGVTVDQLTSPGSTMGGRFGIVTAPDISGSTAIAWEGCYPPNGAIDPDEQIQMNVELRNVGAGSTTNLVATLQATGGVTAPSSPQPYGALTANGPGVTRAFMFRAAGGCGGTLTLSLQLQDGATNLGTVTFGYPLGVRVQGYAENFDGVTAPALPNGWTATVASGAVAAWATSTSRANTPPNAAWAAVPAFVSDNQLASSPIPIVHATAQVSFWHYYQVESGFDGGVLEISIGGGPYTDIAAAGGSFVSGGYNGQISASYQNPLAGRNAWTGDSGGFVLTTVNLPAVTAGQDVRLRWRLGSDSSVGSGGWSVDTFQLYNGYSCCHRAPGDMDADGDVDQTDFGYFQACLKGVGILQADPACGAARLDADTDVDSDDFAIFSACLSGPQVPARFDCRP